MYGTTVKKKPLHVSGWSTCSFVTCICKSNVGCRWSSPDADHVNDNSLSRMNNSSLRHLKRPWVEQIIEFSFRPHSSSTASKAGRNLKPGSCSAYCKSTTCEIQLCQRNCAHNADIHFVQGRSVKRCLLLFVKRSSLPRNARSWTKGLYRRSISLPSSLFREI